MDINGKTVLILGGWGLVGAAVNRRLFSEKPKTIVVASLLQQEAEQACRNFSEEAPDIEFVPEWGDIFVRDEFKTQHREALHRLEQAISPRHGVSSATSPPRGR